MIWFNLESINHSLYQAFYRLHAMDHTTVSVLICNELFFFSCKTILFNNRKFCSNNPITTSHPFLKAKSTSEDANIRLNMNPYTVQIEIAVWIELALEKVFLSLCLALYIEPSSSFLFYYWLKFYVTLKLWTSPWSPIYQLINFHEGLYQRCWHFS